jgi:hypothetical protein
MEIAWKDEDGTWYDGPAYENMTRTCASCGWTQLICQNCGKTTSVTVDGKVIYSAPGNPEMGTGRDKVSSCIGR